MGRREAILLAVGLTLLASSLVLQALNVFGVSYLALGEYTGLRDQTGYTIFRIVQSLAGTFMVVLGWKKTEGDGGFLAPFGKPSDRSPVRFWTEIALNEAFGLAIVWSVFVMTQSPFYYLPGFPLPAFEVAGQLVLFVGEFLVAKSTFSILAEVLA